ncbi:MAG: hypothetical protein C4520_04570 [Candidatus Abyssobacteria bacterium SURF_5]|uniref:LUD domain-containing protein n=1 Tax=Abyssobacteria bacterium (strain SURF_5) TaxID=2093360 RepID=A0A3A4NUD7_ABYX5|nr:MAG: hypothetical protein C4520_04570 [Candidatus Abyssubacteria bacterium SURF_5]
MTNPREDIFSRLNSARGTELPQRPFVPPLSEISHDRDRMIRAFTDNLTAQTAVVHHVADFAAAAEKLAEVVAAENIKSVVVSSDAVIRKLDLPEWGRKHNLTVLQAEDCTGREHFKNMVFAEADAAITGADFAIAESGTLCLIHDKDQPRLISLAPIMHIALVPLERLFPVYESAIDRIFGDPHNVPSHVTFITGPSMTADIQGVPFKGMHGPKKLTVILIG